MTANAQDLNYARSIWSNLNLGQNFYPVKRFGENSAYGKIYLTSGNKLMKITPWTLNSKREMNIAKRAGVANVGPKVYNTRKISHRKRTLAVMTMDKVPNAKSLYNAINSGNIQNFKQITNAVARLHRAGIHHGNLHGGNILVYRNASGNLKFTFIDFGASKYHPEIKNMNSAIKYAINRAGWRGGSQVVGGFQNLPGYSRPGRNQLVTSNSNRLRNIERYFRTR
jgi:tRNA A-37 threonylcarbamoyl transferase component Bud32